MLLLEIGSISAASAQLSPGKLSRAHAELDGLSNCTKCHALRTGVSPSRCLHCHDEIRLRVDAGRGLHAAKEYASCTECHTDHHGRDYDLIFWSEGRERFDHGRTGYSLEGRHAAVGCRDCHQASKISRPDSLGQGKNPDRTFLGLSSGCAACHADRHRGQFETTCDRCHSPDDWRPAHRFDHQQSRYPLTGRHREAKCTACHRPDLPEGMARSAGTAEASGAAETAPAAGATEPRGRLDSLRASGANVTRDPADVSPPLRYRGLPFDDCGACHSDRHQGRIAGRCDGCHQTAGWRKPKGGAFDHQKTHYPLRGRHQSVACDRCHRSESGGDPLSFAACRDCHQDSHRGRFTAGPEGGACDRCHTVDGFSPSRFTIEEHERTRFPLTGAHLATPCIACHTRNRTAGVKEPVRFEFGSRDCVTCHADPHRGASASAEIERGCPTCHQVSSWREIAYDHRRTRFPLQGRHREASCRSCHQAPSERSDAGGSADPIPKFVPLSEACASCHRDRHGGQFADSAGRTDCGQCHGSDRWKADRFAHDRDSRFPLAGAHAQVACGDCHHAGGSDPEAPVQYRPLDRRCAACHQAERSSETPSDRDSGDRRRGGP